VSAEKFPRGTTEKNKSENSTIKPPPSILNQYTMYENPWGHGLPNLPPAADAHVADIIYQC